MCSVFSLQCRIVVIVELVNTYYRIPSLKRVSTRLEPINPAAPVTITLPIRFYILDFILEILYRNSCLNCEPLLSLPLRSLRPLRFVPKVSNRIII